MKLGKISKSLAALSLIALYSVSTFGATITDVATNHWAYNAIVDVQNRGFMAPNSAGQFLPASTMNYFEVADVLAKATGYVDVQVNTNIDETFKNQIVNNYNNQKATLAAYAAKYTTWDKTYDQQVAYLLGRGYISTSDLDKFISKTTAGEAKSVMTKEDLAVFLVRVLGKETTAKNTYTTTGFSDESSIAEANRPHVAYLKTLNLVSGNASGAFVPDTKVSKALCAKMLSDVLKYKESTQSNSNTTTSGVQSETVTIKKILTKNTTEYYMLLERGSNTSYYTIKNTVQILDEKGNVINIAKVPLQSKATVKIELEGNTEYITSMKLQAEGSTDTTPGTTTDTTTDTTETTSSFKATLTEQSANSIVRMTLADGTIKAYLLDSNCKLTLDGKAVSADEIAVGDSLNVTLRNNTIISLEATTTTKTSSTKGELLDRVLTTTGYTFTIKDGTRESELSVPKTATITRNSKTVTIDELRIGDQLEFVKSGNEVTNVVATSTTSKVKGTVNAIYISTKPEITVKTEQGLTTYAVADDTEFYDETKGKETTIRGVHLGQTVTLELDSKEILSLDIEDVNSSVSYKATITAVGKGYEYIDVIVDYDPVTGMNQVVKRIPTSTELSILLNGKQKHRSELEEDMDIVIYYQYLDENEPEKILIIG